MEEELRRWARDEMGIPKEPSAATLRRLCSGQGAEIWKFVMLHVKSARNVAKIRGNLQWQQHLEELQGSHSPPPELTELRRDVEDLKEAVKAAESNVVSLEAELGTVARRRRAGLNRAQRLRLLAEAANREGKRLRAALPVPPPLPRPLKVEPDLEIAVAMGLEPEVLVSTRALCRMREEALKSLLEPRPLPEMRQLMDASIQTWRQAAQDLLSRHPPAAVLWALCHMTTESIRELQALLRKDDVDPNEDPEAPSTVETLIKQRWVLVGGLWARAPPLAARLPPLRQRLRDLQEELGGGQPERLALSLAHLEGFRGGLLAGIHSLKGPHPPKNEPPPQRRWEELKSRAAKDRNAVLQKQRRLQLLMERNAGSRERLREQQKRVQEAAAALIPVPLALEEEGLRLGEALGELGALGPPPAPTSRFGAPLALPPEHPLLGVCESLGLPLYKAPCDALRRAVELREELHWLRAVGGACADPIEAPPTEEPDEDEKELAELLPRLRTVASQCRSRIEAWPRLQSLVDQWWEQPAQWISVPSPGRVPFSHWMERWRRATGSHAPSGLQKKPRL